MDILTSTRVLDDTLRDNTTVYVIVVYCAESITRIGVVVVND